MTHFSLVFNKWLEERRSKISLRERIRSELVSRNGPHGFIGAVQRGYYDIALNHIGKRAFDMAASDICNEVDRLIAGGIAGLEA